MKSALKTDSANESFCSHRFRACVLITTYLCFSESDCTSDTLRQIRMEECKVTQRDLKRCASPKFCHATVLQSRNARHILISPSQTLSYLQRQVL